MLKLTMFWAYTRCQADAGGNKGWSMPSFLHWPLNIKPNVVINCTDAMNISVTDLINCSSFPLFRILDPKCWILSMLPVTGAKYWFSVNLGSQILAKTPPPYWKLMNMLLRSHNVSLTEANIVSRRSLFYTCFRPHWWWLKLEKSWD